MRDEMDSRMWNEHHEAFGKWVVDAISGLRVVSERLHAHLWDAPWKDECDGLA